MSELKLVSPLLDQMSVEEEIAGHNGCTCYALRHVQSGERFVVKRISVPASDLQVRALILSGAYPDDAAVHAYYGSVAEDIKNELDTGMRLAENGYFAGASSYQIEPKESGIGYGSVNHPVDRDPVCGYNGIIEDVCPKCGRTEDEHNQPFERIRRITGYLVGTLDRFNDAKRAEEHDRVKHDVPTAE